MVQTLESIKGGGGSIKVGTTGTIGSLMTRELESLKNVPAAPVTPRRRAQMASIPVPCGSSTSKVLQPSQSGSNEASSSSNNGNSTEDTTTQKTSGTGIKPKSGIPKNGQRVPMISLDGISTPTAKTPNRNKTDKKGSYIVEVVDIHCGHPDKAWVTNRLKKLGFSKLSESIS